MGFGKELKKIRETRGLSKRALAKYAGVSDAYIVQLERGDKISPSPTFLKKLSKPLHVPYEVLMQKAGYLSETICEEVGRYNINSISLEGLSEKDAELVKEMVARLKQKQNEKVNSS